MTANVSRAFAQRFTSEDPLTVKHLTPDTGFINAERSYLALKAGNLDEARKFLSLADASNPFAMYVRASLTPDATNAVGIYKLIVAQFHGKPIAREALIQLYKYHYAAGNYRLAHTDYLELRKYPGTIQLVDPAGFKDTLQSSVTPMQPVAVDTPSVQAPEKPPVESEESYSVQLGVFSSQANADRFVADMKTKNIGATISTREGSSRTLYIVTTGTFQTREDADAFATDLKNKSINCIVVKIGESRE